MQKMSLDLVKYLDSRGADPETHKIVGMDRVMARLEAGKKILTHIDGEFGIFYNLSMAMRGLDDACAVIFVVNLGIFIRINRDEFMTIIDQVNDICGVELTAFEILSHSRSKRLTLMYDCIINTANELYDYITGDQFLEGQVVLLTTGFSFYTVSRVYRESFEGECLVPRFLL